MNEHLQDTRHIEPEALEAVHGGQMISMPWDYAAYGAAYAGGVAGHFAGGGGWSDVPWTDIDRASRGAPLR